MIRTRTILPCALVTWFAPPARADTVLPVCPDEVCRDPSDVLGERTCPRFAAWSTEGPNAFAEIGVRARHLPVAPRPRAIERAVTTPRDASDDAVGISFVERIGFRLGPVPYVFGEAEFGAGGLSIGASAGDRVALFGALAGAGARLPLGFGSIGAEVGGGFRVASTLPDQFDDGSEGVVEARGRGSLWLSPWVSLDVMVGRSLLHDGDWMMGVSVSVDTYAFGRAR